MSIKQRKVETNHGIQNETTVKLFDQFARRMRDKGWNGVDYFLASGIREGKVLEIGPGPGYVGLEWLKKCEKATLTALEISPAMIRIAEKNAKVENLSHRVKYIEGNCLSMPFENNSYDAVFSNGSLHEWESPEIALREIFRVLKPGGTFCISDLRRDLNLLVKSFLFFSVQPKEIRPGMLTSLAAAYTISEIEEIMRRTDFEEVHIRKDFCGLTIRARKLV